MTGALAADRPDRQKLPLWRAIAGFGLLGILVALLVIAGLVYLDNFRLDRYMRGLAESAESVGLSDAALSDRLVARARDLGLPVQAGDISISRVDRRPHIRIARYRVETPVGHMDLSLRKLLRGKPRRLSVTHFTFLKNEARATAPNTCVAWFTGRWINSK